LKAAGIADQNQRSCTLTVSPGRIGKLGGTDMRTIRPATGRSTVRFLRNARGVNPPAMATAV
jgi:hypothetical protein